MTDGSGHAPPCWQSTRPGCWRYAPDKTWERVSTTSEEGSLNHEKAKVSIKRANYFSSKYWLSAFHYCTHTFSCLKWLHSGHMYKLAVWLPGVAANLCRHSHASGVRSANQLAIHRFNHLTWVLIALSKEIGFSSERRRVTYVMRSLALHGCIHPLLINERRHNKESRSWKSDQLACTLKKKKRSCSSQYQTFIRDKSLIAQRLPLFQVQSWMNPPFPFVSGNEKYRGKVWHEYY